MKLSRRNLLQASVGAAAALPMIQALTGALPGARADSAKAPKRLVFIYIPNGFKHTSSYTPVDTPSNGTPYTLPSVLLPFAPLQKKLTIISNLDNSVAVSAGADNHSGGVGGLLTSYPCQQSGSSPLNGTSVDQVYADHVGSSTPISSLVLGVEYPDGGINPTLGANLSWAGSTPIAKEIDAARLFQRLFGQIIAAPDELARQRAHQKAVLDYASGSGEALRSRLGGADRSKVDQYLAGLVALQAKAQSNSLCGVAPPVMPGALDNDGSLGKNASTGLTAHIDTMSDLLAHAFACDLTRSASFMLPCGFFSNFQFLGFSDQHHGLTHIPDSVTVDPSCGLTPGGKLDAICTWQSARIAHLLSTLDSMIDVDGRTILDNTLVFVSSDVGDGQLHSHSTMPVLLAGGGGTVTKMGRHITAGPGGSGQHQQQPFANLFVSMLQFAGVNATTFGHSSLAAHALDELMV